MLIWNLTQGGIRGREIKTGGKLLYFPPEIYPHIN
jgi:hypothetical protein